MIDKVAPWLGPIGTGLQVSAFFVSIFVKGKEKTIKEIGEENLKLNTMILKNVTEVLDEIKKLEYFLIYEKELKKFKAAYETYRDKLFKEGKKEAWDFTND